MANPRIKQATPRDGPAYDVPVAEQLLLDIIDTIREPLLVLDPEFRITQANRAFFDIFRVEREDTIGEVLFSLGDGQWDIAPLRELLRDKLAVEPRLNDFEVDHVFPGIGRKIMLLNARLVAHGPNTPRIILLAIEDITVRRITELRLAEQRTELQRSNAALDEFASVASHDLQEPLRKILSFGERLNMAASRAHARRDRAHAHADQRSPLVFTGIDARPAVHPHGLGSNRPRGHRRSRDGHCG
jgi:PAS domain S-box-containing protein